MISSATNKFQVSDVLPGVAALADRVGASWTALQASRALTVDYWNKLDTTLAGACSSETSIVIFGSIARGEATANSDADWSFLVDGQADPRHAESAQEIGDKISQVVATAPGREGVFGNMAFSHDLIQLIGGEDDTNRNLTRRNLLLLESRAFGQTEAHERTVKQVLHRYIAEDLDHATPSREFYVPRFLLNDFARFWRTMAVDFAYKRKGRHGRGIALRNVKLRMSRKLLFASGLVACFACELGLSAGMCQSHPRKPNANFCQGCLRPFFDKPPLENLAAVFAHFLETKSKGETERIESTAKLAFGAYDEFIALLNDERTRQHLEQLDFAALEEDPAFNDARQISRKFRDALQTLFFDSDDKLTRMTRKYGVF